MADLDAGSCFVVEQHQARSASCPRVPCQSSLTPALWPIQACHSRRTVSVTVQTCTSRHFPCVPKRADPSTGSRPSIFYPAPRAKYDSWTSIHAHYAAQADGVSKARARYIEIAQSVGWAGEGIDPAEDEAEIDFDEPEPEAEAVAGPSSGKKTPGMGPRVSVMAEGNDESTTQCVHPHANHYRHPLDPLTILFSRGRG